MGKELLTDLKNEIFKNWLRTRPKMETNEPNVYPTILGGVSRGFWGPFEALGARSAIFWHSKTGTFAMLFCFVSKLFCLTFPEAALFWLWHDCQFWAYPGLTRCYFIIILTQLELLNIWFQKSDLVSKNYLTCLGFVCLKCGFVKFCIYMRSIPVSVLIFSIFLRYRIRWRILKILYKKKGIGFGIKKYLVSGKSFGFGFVQMLGTVSRHTLLVQKLWAL